MCTQDGGWLWVSSNSSSQYLYRGGWVVEALPAPGSRMDVVAGAFITVAIHLVHYNYLYNEIL